MTIRETAISKLQQLPEVLVQEVSDFIDLLDHKYRVKTFDTQPDGKLIEMWLQWFEGVDGLTVNSPEPINDYQQLLLEKYRQQGLELLKLSFELFFILCYQETLLGDTDVNSFLLKSNF